MPTLVEVKGFKYEELSDNAKERALRQWDEDYRDTCVEVMVSDANTLFSNYDSWEFQYSIGFCQGDGVGLKGTMDAADIRDPEWVKTILPMLGAHKRQAKVAGHDVSWPWPIVDARLEFSGANSGPGYSPGFSDGDLEVSFVFADRAYEYEEQMYDTEITVNHYVARDPDDDDRGTIEIWQAMCDYFRTACNKLYRDCSNAILEGDEEGFIYDCGETGRIFDEDGDVIHEEEL